MELDRIGPLSPSRSRGRFELDAKSIRDPVHECEVRDDHAGIVNRPVVEPSRPERRHVRRADRSGRTRQLFGVLQQRVISRRPARAIEHVRGQRRQERRLLVGRHARGAQDATEARRVMMQSIVTAVQRRYPNGERLTLAVRQRPRAVHQLQIQVVVLPHDRRVNAVDLDNVIRIGNTVFGREIRLVGVSNERHR